MIKKIVITVGDKDIKLTMDEAKELKLELDELFGAEEPFKPIPWLPYIPSYPCEPWRPGPIITYKDNTACDPIKYQQVLTTGNTVATN